jgi:hypothetical protein
VLRPRFRLQNDMNMRRTHMDRVKRPPFVPANLSYHTSDGPSGCRIELKACDGHAPGLTDLAHGVRLQEARTKAVVLAVDRASPVPVKSFAAAGEGEEVRPGLIAAGSGRLLFANGLRVTHISRCRNLNTHLRQTHSEPQPSGCVEDLRGR